MAELKFLLTVTDTRNSRECGTRQKGSLCLHLTEFRTLNYLAAQALRACTTPSLPTVEMSRFSSSMCSPSAKEELANAKCSATLAQMLQRQAHGRSSSSDFFRAGIERGLGNPACHSCWTLNWRDLNTLLHHSAALLPCQTVGGLGAVRIKRLEHSDTDGCVSMNV